MVYNWNEINTEVFEYIFRLYWDGHKNTTKKVLEIQNLIGIKDSYQWARIYFGYGIDIRDWKEFNKDSYKLFGTMDNLLPGLSDQIINRNKMSQCILYQEGPRIIPLGLEGHYDLLRLNLFGDLKNNKESKLIALEALAKTNFWYIKDSFGHYRKCPFEDINNYNSKEKFIRIRAIDLEDWKHMVKEFVSTGDKKCLQINKDIKKKYIIL